MEIKEIALEKIAPYAEYFGDREFIYGSPIPFDVSCEGRLPFGSVTLNLCVKKGYIVDVRLYTDALDSEISVAVERALTSLPFELKPISEALSGVLDEADAHALTELLSEQMFS